jgi:hypothetical protein
MDVEGIDPVAVYAAADVHAGPDRVRPAGCRLGLGPARRVVDQLAERFPAAAELLADAAADLLAFTAFPAETGARPGPTIPGAAEQRARRACLPTGGLLVQQDHIGAWVEPLPAGPESQPVSTSIAPQPGTQEIASSNYLSVLVFVHFIELAFTIGVETSFQILEIRSQWLHSPSSSSNRFLSIGHNIRRIWTGSRSDQRAGMAVRQEPRSRRPGGRRPHRRALPLVWARAARGRPDTRSGGLAFAVLIG